MMISEDERVPLLRSDSLMVTGFETDIEFSTESNIVEVIETPQMIVYTRRWFMLFILVILNLSNGIIWITFSPIAEFTAEYYHLTTFQVNMLSIVFMITTIFLAVPVMWLIDNKGLMPTLIFAAWLNGLGACLRIISIIDFIKNEKNLSYSILLLGQTISGCGQPFMLLASTKLAFQWFSPSQRTMANMLGSVANPIGVFLGSFLTSIIVPSAETFRERIPLLLEIFAAPAILGILLSFGVRSNKPPTPPCLSTSEEIVPFASGLKELIKNKHYMVLAICYGGGVGLLSCLVTIFDQLICSHPRSQFLSSVSIGCLFIFGLIGASIFSFIADLNMKHELLAKISYALAALSLIAVVIVIYFRSMFISIPILMSVVGFFGIALNPLCLELGVECSFPVGEGVSGGSLVLIGQVMAAVITLCMTIGSKSISEESCTMGSIIHPYALLAFMILTFIFCVIFLTFFRCQYKRQQCELALIKEEYNTHNQYIRSLSQPTAFYQSN